TSPHSSTTTARSITSTVPSPANIRMRCEALLWRAPSRGSAIVGGHAEVPRSRSHSKHCLVFARPQRYSALALRKRTCRQQDCRFFRHRHRVQHVAVRTLPIALHFAQRRIVSAPHPVDSLHRNWPDSQPFVLILT